MRNDPSLSLAEILPVGVDFRRRDLLKLTIGMQSFNMKMKVFVENGFVSNKPLGKVNIFKVSKGQKEALIASLKSPVDNRVSFNTIILNQFLNA